MRYVRHAKSSATASQELQARINVSTPEIMQKQYLQIVGTVLKGVFEPSNGNWVVCQQAWKIHLRAANCPTPGLLTHTERSQPRGAC